MIKLKDILYEEGLIEGKLQRITNDWWTGEVTGKYDESSGFNMHKQVRMYIKEKPAMRVKKINWRISYIKQYWFIFNHDKWFWDIFCQGPKSLSLTSTKNDHGNIFFCTFL